MTRSVLPIPLRGPLTPQQDAWLHPRRHRFPDITRPHDETDDGTVRLYRTDDPHILIAEVLDPANNNKENA